MIKNLLMYPGGKVYLVPRLLRLLPNFEEYREPFAGGMALALAVAQTKENIKIVVSDIDENVATFWRIVRDKPEELVNTIYSIAGRFNDYREMYHWLWNSEVQDDIFRAARFFILNRCSFGGKVLPGMYSPLAAKTRFGQHFIQRILKVSPIIKDFEILCASYETLLFRSGKNVFIFVDPPYTDCNRVYSHDSPEFDYNKLLSDLTKTPHKWLMTFGSDPVVAAKCRSYGFHVFGWYVQRYMPRDTSRPKAKEIVVTNYELSVEQIKSADLKRVVIEEDIAFEEASLPHNCPNVL